MVTRPRPLIETLAAMPALRRSRRQRHPFSAVFVPACDAMLRGDERAHTTADPRSIRATGGWELWLDAEGKMR
jgi:hypothetical protein